MKKTTLILCFLGLYLTSLIAQTGERREQVAIDGELVYALITEENDTILIADLDDVSVSSPRNFKDRKEYKSYLCSHEVFNEEVGEYLTYGAIVMKLGGWQWEEAMHGARSYITKATLLGPPWAETCDMSGLKLYFYVHKRRRVVFVEKWQHYQEEFRKHHQRKEEVRARLACVLFLLPTS